MTEARAILDANERFYAAFRDRDADAMDAVWAREATIACIHPGWGPLVGRDDVMRSWRQILASDDAPRVACAEPEVTFVGDVAHVICVEHVELAGGDGSGVFVATNLFVREDGAWRLALHQASPLARDDDEDTDAPPPLLN